MTAPGWYHAEGDAAGTQRYWDGSQWVGDPVYETPTPAASPAFEPPVSPPASAVAPPTIAAPPGPPGAPYGSPPGPYGSPGYPAGGYSTAAAPGSQFPTGVKVSAIILSVMKVIPLILLFIAVAFISGVSNDLNDELGLGNDFDDFFDAIAAVFAVIAIIGLLLVGFQFVGALRESAMMVFVPALIMTLLDGLLTLGSWASWADTRGTFAESSAGGPVFMTAILAFQAYIAIGAFRART